MTEPSFPTSEPSIDSSASAELNSILAKKKVLEEVIKISLSAERLRLGLQSAVFLGKASRLIPKKALSAYEALSEEVKHLSTKKLQDGLASLETIIKQDIEKVIEGAQSKEMDLEILPDKNVQTGTGNIHDILNGFRRNSQTAVALRLVLRSRGVPTKQVTFAIPKGVIKTQIKDLEVREQHCRGRIKNDIRSMQIDIENIIQNESYPEEIRQQMRELNISLQDNLQHIEAGKNFEDMPIVIEMLEISGEPAGENVLDSPRETEQPIQETAAEAPGDVTENQQQPHDRSLLSRSWEWLTTPPKVTWHDIGRKQQKDDDDDD